MIITKLEKGVSIEADNLQQFFVPYDRGKFVITINSSRVREFPINREYVGAAVITYNGLNINDNSHKNMWVEINGKKRLIASSKGMTLKQNNKNIITL